MSPSALKSKIRLSAVGCLVVALVSPQFALGALSCQDLLTSQRSFSGPAPIVIPLRASDETKTGGFFFDFPGAEKNAARRRPFDSRQFDQQLDRYLSVKDLSELRNTPEPTTAEGKLAIFEALGRINGRSVLQVEDWMRTTSPKSREQIRKMFAKLRLADGIHTSEAEDVFMRIYLMSHSDPRNFDKILSRKFSDREKTLLLQRFNLEFGRRGLIDALDELGYLSKPGIKDKLRAMYRSEPTLFNGIYTAGFTVALVGAGMPPMLMLGRTFTHFKYLSPETAALAVRFGPEAVFRELQRETRDSAKFDIAYHWGSHIIMAGAIGIGLGLFVQSVGTMYLAPLGVTSKHDNFFEFVIHSLAWAMRGFRSAVGIPAPRGEVAPEKQAVASIVESTQKLQTAAEMPGMVSETIKIRDLPQDHLKAKPIGVSDQELADARASLGLPPVGPSADAPTLGDTTPPLDGQPATTPPESPIAGQDHPSRQQVEQAIKDNPWQQLQTPASPEPDPQQK